ncbi:MAG TPA: DoxX family protein [Vicinamibacterales bacterium]|nr:DoxX family protein [Vicinamibacterales bacterium]
MYAPLSRFVEPAYATMRVVVGFLFAFHGAQKLFGAFDGTARPIASQMGLAGIIEFGGGMLVMIGLLAGLAAFVCSGQMAFAYFLSHVPRGGWPIQNDGELAVLFCFLFLFISARGSGIWSLDGALFRRRRPIHTATAEGLSHA